MYYTNFDAHFLWLRREETVELMHSTRFRCWFLRVPITMVVVGVMWAVVTEWAGQGASAFYWIVGLLGIFVLVGGLFGREKILSKI